MPTTTRTTWLTVRALALVVAMLGAGTTYAESPKPALDYEYLLNKHWFHPTDGSYRLDTQVLGFAPDEFSGEVRVYNAAKELVAKHEMYPQYYGREGVFGAIRPEAGGAGGKLTEPGLYQFVYVVNGEPATVLPVRLKQTGAGDDPFSPKKTYAYDGYWRVLGLFRLEEYDFKRTGIWPRFYLWTGQLDLEPGQDKGEFRVELLRGGEVVAQRPGHRAARINGGHYRQQDIKFVHPHEARQSNSAPAFLLEDYKAGDYEIKVTRGSDGKQIRSYRFTVADGKIQGPAQSELGFEPHRQYLMPRVDDAGDQNMLRMEEAVWVINGAN